MEDSEKILASQYYVESKEEISQWTIDLLTESASILEIPLPPYGTALWLK
jgi:hypothetical protein